MHRAVLLAVLTLPRVAHADEPRRGYAEGVVEAGAMLGAPETVAGILGLGARGGYWLDDPAMAIELMIDVAQCPSPDPEGFDETHFRSTAVHRARALLGLRFGPASRRRHLRFAIGVERIDASLQWEGDFNPGVWTSESGWDAAPTVELATGWAGTGQPHAAFELAASFVRHGGPYLQGYDLEYTSLELEVRLAIAFDL